jgi:hypothetical protein
MSKADDKAAHVDWGVEPATDWSPWFCALAMGVVGTNVALVTVVPCVVWRLLTILTLLDPFDPTCRALGCLALSFAFGAVVGLSAGLIRSLPS